MWACATFLTFLHSGPIARKIMILLRTSKDVTWEAGAARSCTSHGRRRFIVAHAPGVSRDDATLGLQTS